MNCFSACVLCYDFGTLFADTPSPILLQEKSSGSDSDDWGSSSSSSEEEEEEATKGLTGRARWLKKNTAVKEKVVKNKDERAKQRKAAAEKARAVAEAAVTATKSLIPEESLTISLLNKKVKEIASMRGRKGKDNRVILRELEALYRLSQQFGPRTEVPILMNVISAQFGLLRTMDDYMDTLTWKACASHLSRIADVIDQGYTLTPEIIDETDYLTGATKMKAAAMGKGSGGAVDLVAKDEKLVNPHTGEDETQDERDERLRLEQERSMTEEEKKKIPVVGSLSLHLNRLEEEYTKSLQQTSHHSPDYVARLRDESKLVELLTRYQAYFEKQGDVRDAVLLAQLRIEHIYYRHDTIAKQVDRSARFYEMFGDATILHPACVTSDEVGKGQSDFTQFHPAAFAGKPSIEDTEDVDFASLMAELSSFVYKQGTGMAKMRATVCQIYHHALHDRFNEARDLLLMSHLQDTIQNCGDISTMILFNRMMVTVGMCAFRVGRIYDAHQALSDICSGRVRELLAQGFQASRYSDKTLEQEKAEKRRQVPYHMHINLDLLEACHLISAMLLEIPIMAAASVDGDWSARRSRYVSRTFRKYFDQYNHQVFNGPPEQTRDFVMRASMCLKNGDWKACAGFLTGLDVWQLVPGIDAQTQIAAMLKEKIKVEGLRTYMFAFSARYDSMSLEQLCTMFEMAKSEAKNIVSKMMIAREIHASWDQPTETIVFRRVKSSPLQLATLLFAEKAVNLAESNERLLDAQTGGYGFREDWKEDDRFQSRGHHGNRNKHGRRNVPGNKQRGRRY